MFVLIGKLDYLALRIHFSGNVTNPTQYSVFAKPLRQHVYMTRVKERVSRRVSRLLMTYLIL